MLTDEIYPDRSLSSLRKGLEYLATSNEVQIPAHFLLDQAEVSSLAFPRERVRNRQDNFSGYLVGAGDINNFCVFYGHRLLPSGIRARAGLIPHSGLNNSSSRSSTPPFTPIGWIHT